MSNQKERNAGQDTEQQKKARQISGWGPDEEGRDKQDFSDIANPDPLNPEFRRPDRTKEDEEAAAEQQP